MKWALKWEYVLIWATAQIHYRQTSQIWYVYRFLSQVNTPIWHLYQLIFGAIYANVRLVWFFCLFTMWIVRRCDVIAWFQNIKTMHQVNYIRILKHFVLEKWPRIAGDHSWNLKIHIRTRTEKQLALIVKENEKQIIKIYIATEMFSKKKVNSWAERDKKMQMIQWMWWIFLCEFLNYQECAVSAFVAFVFHST